MFRPSFEKEIVQEYEKNGYTMEAYQNHRYSMGIQSHANILYNEKLKQTSR